MKQIKKLAMSGQFISPLIDGLVQERHNSIANTLELRISCINPPLYGLVQDVVVRWTSCLLYLPSYIVKQRVCTKISITLSQLYMMDHVMTKH